jgi:hypothetical protein
MAQFFFFSKKIFEEVFCAARLSWTLGWPSNLKNHITFDLKISYVKKLPCLEAHSIPTLNESFKKSQQF